MAKLGDKGDGIEKLKDGGLIVIPEGEIAKLDEPLAGTPFFTTLQMFDFYGDDPVTVSKVQLPATRIAKEIFYIPALLLLFLLVIVQRRRQTQPAFWGK